MSFKPAGYYAFEVPPGEDGKVWRIANAAGVKLLFTTPIQLAQAPDEFLLPIDVATADGIVAQNVVVTPAPAECQSVCP